MTDSQQERRERSFQDALVSNATDTGRIVQWLMIVQAVFVAVVVLFLTPRPPLHGAFVMAAAILAGTAGILPVRRAPAATRTRLVVGAAQLVYSGIIIHASGGAMESHFHIFGSLAILAFYRDVRVIGVGVLVTTLDYILRGLYFPESIYGMSDPQLARSLVHIAWVLFEASFLILGIRGQRRRMHDIAATTVERQDADHRTAALLEETVAQLSIGERLTGETRQALEMVQRIAESLENLQQTEAVVHEANTDINEATAATDEQMQSLADRAADQASHVAESSAAIEEMVANIGSVNQIVQRQTSSINTVSEDVGQAQNDADLLSSTMEKLGYAGGQIQEMVSVIANVAAQTQLLAMNAAIEAAHAGDAGRGFAVVAGEIRKLSEQTGEEVTDIQSQVQTITASIDEARGAVERSATSYRAAAEGFSSVRQAFSQIAAANEELTQGGNEVLEAIGALQEITNAVRDLSSSTRETQRGVTSAAKTLNHARRTLSHVTGEITDAMGRISTAVETAAEISSQLETQLESVAAKSENR